MTILLDIWITEHGSGDSNWINILNGSNNFTLKVQNIYICSLREPVRNKVISSCAGTNENVRGLKLSSLNFVDWPEVRITLSIIETCSKISMLYLSKNNMFDSSPKNQVGRSQPLVFELEQPVILVLVIFSIWSALTLWSTLTCPRTTLLMLFLT